MFILNGNPLPLDTAFEDNGVSYPANWLRLASPEEREAIGITDIPDYPRPDDRFYWVTQNPDGTYTATPKDLPTLKTNWSTIVDQIAYSFLQPSDWMSIRKLEDNTEVPANWLTYRQAVRTNAATNKTNLNAANNIDDFIAVATNLSWPVSPIS